MLLSNSMSLYMLVHFALNTCLPLLVHPPGKFHNIPWIRVSSFYEPVKFVLDINILVCFIFVILKESNILVNGWIPVPGI
jgi:hypothetical protein